MRYALLLAAPLLIAAAGDMSVATFLTKANALQRKGPLALMSSDFGLLKREVEASTGAWARGQKVARARGDGSLGCLPAGQTNLSYGQKQVLADMNAIPAAERARTTVRQAVARGWARRYPCRD